MKRSPMPERRTPLKRTAALSVSPLARSQLHANQAGQRHKPKAQRRVKPAVPAKILIALAVRSNGVCEMALTGCTGRATDPAHRLARGAGGRKGQAKQSHDVLSNLTHACRHCHSFQTAEPAWAYSVGLALPMGFDPTSEPVLYRGMRRWLTDDGSVLNHSPTTRLREAS